MSFNVETIIYEEPIIKRRNPKRKGNPMQCLDTKIFMKIVGDSYNVHIIKQLPMHPRDRLARKTKTLQYPRDRVREEELKIARGNVSALMRAKFAFDPEVFVNKTVLFDTSKIDEEKIIDRILENIAGDNDVFTLFTNQAQTHFVKT